VDLRTVLRDNPESTRALALIGQAYTATGSTDLANESYGKAFELNPRSPAIVNAYVNLLIRNNNPQQADEVLRRSIGAGNRDPEVLKLLTQVKLMLGEWDQAEQLAQSLKSIDGQEALSEQVLGLVYQGRGQPEQSIAAFKRAHELAPDATRPVMALVQAYVDNNQVAEARKFLQTVIEKNKNNVTAYLVLGQLSWRENDTQAAIDYFQQAVEINPTFEPGYRALASVYMRQNRLQDAERILQAGLQEIPGNVTLSVNLASVYEGQKAFDKAIDVYEKLLQADPDLIVAKNNLASMLSDHRQDRESHQRARQIAAEFRDSSVPQFRDTYAWASVVAGTNLEEAVVILEGIVRENEQVAVYAYHLGEAYRRKGDPANAIAYLDKAAELAGPDSDIAAQALASKNQIQ
jgi:cellulose synthase operon protein C